MDKKIVIIDDDKDILEAIKDLLEMEGYQVYVSQTGENILEILRSFRPNLILLDLLLSGESGISICETIRETEDIKTIPIIIMSAHPYAQKTIEGSGVNEFLRKPFDIEQFLLLLQKYMPSH